MQAQIERVRSKDAQSGHSSSHSYGSRSVPRHLLKGWVIGAAATPILRTRHAEFTLTKQPRSGGVYIQSMSSTPLRTSEYEPCPDCQRTEAELISNNSTGVYYRCTHCGRLWDVPLRPWPKRAE